MNIEHNFQILASPETVYHAITTPAGIRGWWSNNSSIAPQVGGIHQMHFAKGDQIVTMQFKVDELQPGRRIAWTCIANDNPAWINTQLVFEIEGADNSVSFKFQHIGFKEQWKDTPPYLATVEGWHLFVNSLKQYSETGIGQPM